VGNVAGLAAVCPGSSMLKDKRAALVGVALEAGLFPVSRRCQHLLAQRHAAGLGWSAVWIVTVRTLNCAFVHAMLRRHGELRTNLCVAAVAKVGLLVGEQCFRRLRVVNGMAIRTREIGLNVRRTPNLGAWEFFTVTIQAEIYDVFNLQFRDHAALGAVAEPLDVFFPRAVATLATGVRWFFFARSDALGMGISEEVVIRVGVAFPARRAAGKTLDVRLCSLRLRQLVGHPEPSCDRKREKEFHLTNIRETLCHDCNDFEQRVSI